MRVLVVDGMNFLHRARSGFTLGEHAVSYNAFRNLRALVEAVKAESVCFVLEGNPRDRLALFPDYKANRVEKVDPTDPKSVRRAEELASFFRQADEVSDLLRRAFPVRVVRHPHYECDDVVYTLCRELCDAGEEVVVASNDTDFIQLLNEFPRVSLWNPHQKEYVPRPDYSYVEWKSLRGDPTDNIPRLPGVGDVTAEKAVRDPKVMREILDRPGNLELFERNVRLIGLKMIPGDELHLMERSTPRCDWHAVIGAFKGWGFKAIFKDKTWATFKATFEALSVS